MDKGEGGTENASKESEKSIGTGTSPSPNDSQKQKGLTNVTLSAADIKHRCATDLDMFSALMLEGIPLVPYPAYYHNLWQLFTTLKMDSSKVFRFALGLPRGHAKTTFIKLLICWLVLYHRASFVLMVCSTEPHSYNMMDDVDYMLAGRNVRQVWGNWKSGLVRDTKGLKRGKFNGAEVVLAALGAGTSVRGLNILNNRPDVIIMDDIQTKECAKSETENQSLMEWLTGTLIKCRDMDKSLLIYIGNMYNEDCILNQLKLHKQWQSFVIGAILADWTTLWPDKFTLTQLLEEYKHDNALGLGDIWYSEVMNIPVGGKLSLLPDGKVPFSNIIDGEEPIGCFLTIDPSGYRKDSDDTVIVGHKIYAPMVYQVEEIQAGVMNPGECISNALEMASRLGATHIFVETVAYQQTLKWHLEEAVKDMVGDGLAGIEICEVKPARRNKTSRIRTWIKALLEGTYSLKKDCRNAVMFQALAFKIERQDNTDDILDACSYGIDVRNDWQDAVIDAMALVGEGSRAGGIRINAHVIDNNSFLD